MPSFRRYFAPGATYFFTVVTHGRAAFLCTDAACGLLRVQLQRCQAQRPFDMPAMSLLPDHFHVLWTLPASDDRYPTRLGWVKKEFTKGCLARGGAQRHITHSQAEQHRRGVWQPRYWEHTVRDENDFERHFDYIHYNPVKHGLVARVRAWPYSSFHRWVRAGVYPPNWGEGPMAFDDLDQTAME